jgi:hypothetical protein
MEENKYHCDICIKNYKNNKSLWKHNYTYHKPKNSQIKTNCLPDSSQKLVKEIEEEEKVFFCKFCKNIYKHASSKSKHEKKCKSEEKIKDTEFKNQKKQISDMQKQIDELKKMITMTNGPKNIKQNANSINNGSIDNSKKIIINNFGKEDISYLTNDTIKNLIKHLQFDDEYDKPVSKLAKEIHFNKNHKENNNVKITSMRSPTCRVFENGKWIIKDIDETLVEMVENTSDKFSNIYKKNKKHLHDNYKEYHENYEYDIENNPDVKESIKTNIKKDGFIFTKNNDVDED